MDYSKPSIPYLLPDPRDKRYVQHDQLTLLRQRVYALCQGYEDLNDHNELRQDLAFQTAVERDLLLGSSPTLCRLENRTDRTTAVAIHQVLIEQFIASHKEPPEELILDFDATDDRVHGHQEGRFFHGYYDGDCFLSLLVKRLRQVWPTVRIVFREDSGFYRHRILRWCERHGIGYIEHKLSTTKGSDPFTDGFTLRANHDLTLFV